MGASGGPQFKNPCHPIILETGPCHIYLLYSLQHEPELHETTYNSIEAGILVIALAPVK